MSIDGTVADSIVRSTANIITLPPAIAEIADLNWMDPDLIQLVDYDKPDGSGSDPADKLQ
ncbi:Uncharacterized protein BM_BM18089 [Brugia malayi]|uniref:Uncharacterized protein n=1 Tax=Brugia malayi TaxID=6279 RepID=A0A4E9F278_BRUMA|nr:Uncharacterized protein BM_BM18089 [Brugia malayi]VIO89954.1 Uncharacterized protein BM_BM18089 [Brugia malayi]